MGPLYSLPYSMVEVTTTVPNKGTLSERSKKHHLCLIFKIFFSQIIFLQREVGLQVQMCKTGKSADEAECPLYKRSTEWGLEI